tara:strand:+ start:515 stop:1327 length:813 start_codon:yes stop_codon:yes gene_type:complete
METVKNFIQDSSQKVSTNITNNLNIGGSVKTIALGVLLFVFLIILFFIVSRLFNKKLNGIELISGPVEPKSKPIICTDLIETSDSNEYTYSFWTYIKTFNEGYKKIFYRTHESDGSQFNIVFGFLNEYSNGPTLYIHFEKESSYGNMIEKSYYGKYKLENIRLQTWNHFVISIWGKTMDIYLNGKLARTFILPYELEPSIPEQLGVGEEEEKTYDGYFSRLRYFPRTISSHEIYKLYENGPQATSLLNIISFDKLANVNMSLNSAGYWNE